MSELRTDIDGVIIHLLTVHEDPRGWLAEIYRRDDLGKKLIPAMAYVSMTRPGVTRGPHEHRDQTDLFAFVGPSDFRLYLWDNRPRSTTFGRRFTAELGETRRAVVIVPEGVVHAYKNIGSADGLVFNAPNRLYRGDGGREPIDEIRHEDDPNSPFQVD
jgi:dTDP-4-dehydrorhamnose 3,5-epimerase